MLVEPVLDDRPLGCLDLVEALHRASMRRVLQRSGIGSRLGRDRAHRLDELVEGLSRLRLGRLDHQSLGNDEGEIDRGRMDAVIH